MSATGASTVDPADPVSSIWRVVRQVRPASERLSSKFAARYGRDPVAFVEECFVWGDDRPERYQLDFIDLCAPGRRVSLRSGHGVGKTATEALLLLWWALVSDAMGADWKAITTASARNQLTRFLWPEIHKWARRLRWDLIGRPPFDPRTELLRQSLTLRYGSAFLLSPPTHQEDVMEGGHADRLAYFFDEAKIILPKQWESAEGAFASQGEHFFVAVSTPGASEGVFYDIHRRAPGYESWSVRHVTADEAVAAGRMRPDWVEEKRAQWGPDSAVFANRVLGEFADASDDGVIPLSWVEAAHARWAAWAESGSEHSEPLMMATDVGLSHDHTVHAYRSGSICTRLDVRGAQSTMVTSGQIVRRLGADGDCVRGIIDATGVGAGVFDRVRELVGPVSGHQVLAYHGAAGTGLRDRSGELSFVNTRSAAWWSLRDRLHPDTGDNIALPSDDILTGDLTAPTWRLTSSAKIALENKEDLVRRMGRSPDRGDAVVMLFWIDSRPPPAEMALDVEVAAMRDGGRQRRRGRMWG